MHLSRMYPKMIETQSPMQMSSNAKMPTSAADHASHPDDSRLTFMVAAASTLWRFERLFVGYRDEARETAALSPPASMTD